MSRPCPGFLSHEYTDRDGVSVCRVCGMVRNKDRADQPNECLGKLPQIVPRAQRKGPRMLPIAFTCDGCEHLESQYHTCQGDVACGMRVRIASSRVTPPECPLLPKRVTIGTCAECAHFNEVEGCMSADVPELQTIGLPPTFGCIHWEKKP
jgi:hypothetical protein